MAARFGAGFLLLACACSNDTFVSGQDGSVDASADASGDVQSVDVITLDGASASFCAVHPAAFFCDDWDDASEATAWSKWSTTTPSPPSGAIAFGVGVTGRGVTIKANALSTAYLTRQTQGNALLGLAFDMNLASVVASTTFVRVQAESKTLTIATDVTGNLTVTGDSGGAQTLGPAATGFHHFDVTFANQKATVTEDNGAHATSAGFSPQAPTTSTLDIGVVTGAVGGSVTFDDVLLR